MSSVAPRAEVRASGEMAKLNLLKKMIEDGTITDYLQKRASTFSQTSDADSQDASSDQPLQVKLKSSMDPRRKPSVLARL